MALLVAKVLVHGYLALLFLEAGSRNQEEEPEAKQRCLPHNGWQPSETGRKGTWYTSRAREHGSRDPPPNMLHLIIFLKLLNNVIKF